MAAPATALPNAFDPSVSFSKEYEALRDGLLRELNSMSASAPPASPGMIGQFRIKTSNPLPEFDTQLTKAYAVDDEKDPTRSLYAVVCNPRMPARGKAIKALSGVSVPYLCAMVTHGTVELPGMQGKRLVLIYERPKGKSLSAIIAERDKPLSEAFIAEHIIAPLGAVVAQLAEFGFSHGRINPNTIYFAETVMLTECASEPCGYSQPYQFEPTDRAQANPAGKGEGSPAQDYYALGVLTAYLKMGNRAFDKSQTIEQHINGQLHDGSYFFFAQNLEFTDAMTDILRGTLNDATQERWTWQQIKPWASGRRFNMLPPAAPASAPRPLVIDRRNFNNLREASHALYKHWELVSILIRDGTLTRWVDLSARRKDIAEILKKSIVSLAGADMRGTHHGDELIGRCITILDPQAPLSMKDVRAHVDGLGGLLAESFRTGTQQHIQHLIEILEQGQANIWADMHKRREQQLTQEISNTLWMLDRQRILLKMQGYGFGIERLLYDLNPDLPCQSPLTADCHVSSLREFLVLMDRLAAEKARTESPLDRHTAAYMASKLGLAREITVAEFNSMPSLAKHKSIITLKLFEQAQEAANRPRVPALSTWIAIEVLGSIEQFHSRSLRAQLQEGIKQLASLGYLKPLYEFLDQKVYADVDTNGYKEAVQTYHRMGAEISMLKNKTEQKRRATLGGYSVAKYIAHLIMFTACALVAKKYIMLG